MFTVPAVVQSWLGSAGDVTAVSLESTVSDTSEVINRNLCSLFHTNTQNERNEKLQQNINKDSKLH